MDDCSGGTDAERGVLLPVRRPSVGAVPERVRELVERLSAAGRSRRERVIGARRKLSSGELDRADVIDAVAARLVAAQHDLVG